MSIIRDDESPELLFVRELQEALSRERLRVSDEAEAYLARLLARIRADQRPEAAAEPLSPDFLKALGSAGEQERIVLLRHVGDSALLLCGWWWWLLERVRQPLDPKFHASLGRKAYRLMDEKLFDELSEKFAGLVDVLARMSGRLQTADERALMELYSHWLRTHSRQAARILAAKGIVVTGDERKH